MAYGYLFTIRTRDGGTALHDCDIVNYDRQLLARFCYPVTHPHLAFRVLQRLLRTGHRSQARQGNASVRDALHSCDGKHRSGDRLPHVSRQLPLWESAHDCTRSQERPARLPV